MSKNTAPTVVPETLPVETEPLTDVELDVLNQVSYDNMFRLVVWDDDVNEFDYVVKVFVKYFNLSVETAFERTWEIHHYGKSVLAQGSRTEMDTHASILGSQYGLTTTVEEDN